MKNRQGLCADGVFGLWNSSALINTSTSQAVTFNLTWHIWLCQTNQFSFLHSDRSSSDEMHDSRDATQDGTLNSDEEDIQALINI